MLDLLVEFLKEIFAIIPVKSIDDHFKFYTPIKLVLLNDFERLKYTFASTKESDIWNSIKEKYRENIVSASIFQ